MINNGQNVSAEVTNPAFMDKNIDTYALGKVDLRNAAADVAQSGPNIDNVQRELNSESSYTGKPINVAKDAKPTYTNNQVGAANDDLRTRIDLLTQRFDNSLGHNHDGTQGNGAPVSASGPTPEVEYRTLTSGEASSKSLQLATAPTEPTKVVLAAGGVVQFYGDDFTVSGSGLVEWTGLGLDGTLVAGDKLVIIYWLEATAPVYARYVEYRTLTSGEASAKQLTLSNNPSSSSLVQVDVIGGGPQQLSVDYSVTANVVDWSGLGLDGKLVTGDTLRISY